PRRCEAAKVDVVFDMLGQIFERGLQVVRKFRPDRSDRTGEQRGERLARVFYGCGLAVNPRGAVAVAEGCRRDFTALIAVDARAVHKEIACAVAGNPLRQSRHCKSFFYDSPELAAASCCKRTSAKMRC